MDKVKIVTVDSSGAPLPQTGFYIQFNPEQLQVQEACAAYQESTFPDGSKTTSETKKTAHKDKVNLSAKLFFNTLTSFEQTVYNDVRQAIRQFYTFTNATNATPNKVGFLYGSIALVGYIQSLSVSYTAFDKEGKALRADVDITITGSYFSDESAGNLQDTRSAQIIGTSFLDALKSHGDAREWKSIATANKVADPL